MVSPQPALWQSRTPHIHIAGERCPVCDQPIPNEKAEEVRARIEALAEAANARAAQQIAQEKAQIEANAQAAVEQIRKEGVHALQKAQGEMAAKEAAAHAAGKQEADAALKERLAAAEQAKAALEVAGQQRDVDWQQKIAAVERAKVDAESVAQQRIAALELTGRQIEANANAAVEQIRKEGAEALQKAQGEMAAKEAAARAAGKKEADAALVEKLAAAERDKLGALGQYEALKADHDRVVNERVQEVREAMEAAKTNELNAERANHFDVKQKLTGKLDALTRQLENKTADELGEGAEVNLFEVLKREFEGDRIERIRKGVSGADIIHTVVHNGQACGKIIYDSKNSMAWRDDYVSKLAQDQTAAKADHAMLCTFKLPANARQVDVRHGVVIANPARALALVQMIRRHIVQVHTLRLSKMERAQKMAALYDFITSERCGHLLARIESHAEALLELQEKEMKAHQAHWKHEGTHLKSIQKVKAELETEIDCIIGTDNAAA